MNDISQKIIDKLIKTNGEECVGNSEPLLNSCKGCIFIEIYSMLDCQLEDSMVMFNTSKKMKVKEILVKIK